jgi:uncharacterized membrane protein YuzA (DUF378 family)
MSMSTFTFIASVLFALMTLAFTMVGVSTQDLIAIYMGNLMAICTVLFFAVGLILSIRGE